MPVRNWMGLVSLWLIASASFAGVVQPAEVLVELNSDNSGRAQGDMVSARFADNENAFIGCGVRVYDDGTGGSFNYGFCQAGDADGNRAFCTTFRPDLLDGLDAISAYSFVTFSFNAAGECDYIGVSSQSFYIPEQAAKSKKSKK